MCFGRGSGTIGDSAVSIMIIGSAGLVVAAAFVSVSLMVIIPGSVGLPDNAMPRRVRNSSATQKNPPTQPEARKAESIQETIILLERLIFGWAADHPSENVHLLAGLEQG